MKRKSRLVSKKSNEEILRDIESMEYHLISMERHATMLRGIALDYRIATVLMNKSLYSSIVWIQKHWEGYKSSYGYEWIGKRKELEELYNVGTTNDNNKDD